MLFERFMTPGKHGRTVPGILLGLAYLSLLGAKYPPVAPFGGEMGLWGRLRAARTGNQAHRPVRVLCHFVCLEELLNPTAYVTSGANQVLLGIRQFVLVKRDFSPENLDLLLQAGLLPTFGILGLRGKLLDLALVSIHVSLGLLYSLLEGTRLRVLNAGFPLSLPQGNREGRVQFAIGHSHRILCQLLLFR
jgi:hypothetical protein